MNLIKTSILLIFMGCMISPALIAQTSEESQKKELKEREVIKNEAKNNKSAAPEDPGIVSSQGQSVIGGDAGMLVIKNNDETSELRIDQSDIQKYDVGTDSYAGTLYLQDQGGDVRLAGGTGVFDDDGDATIAFANFNALSNTATISGRTIISDDLEVSGSIGLGIAPNAFVPFGLSTPYSAMGRFNSTASSASIELYKSGIKKGSIWNTDDDIVLTSSVGMVQLAVNTNDRMLTVETDGSVVMGPYVGASSYSVKAIQQGAFGFNLERESSGNDWEMYISTAATDAGLTYYYNGSLRGTFSAVDGIYTASDRRLKRNVKALGTILPSLMKIEVNKYQYKDSEKVCTGFIAQNIKENFPEFVLETDDERSESILQVNYANMSSIAIKAIQEQQVIITELQAENKALADRLTKIEKLLEE